MNWQIANIESDVARIKSDISEMQNNIRELRRLASLNVERIGEALRDAVFLLLPIGIMLMVLAHAFK